MKNKFAYLLKRGTTWNHLKPPRNYMKPFETTWNQSYCSIFVPKINYSQVAFIQILQPKVVFGQIWSPKLSFPNWRKFGAGVHCYILTSNLIFIFSKFCHSYFFEQVWSQNLKLSKLTEIWYRCTLLCAYHDFNIHFSKTFVIHDFVDKFGPTIWISSNWLKFHRRVHCCMLITISMFIFSKFCH